MTKINNLSVRSQKYRNHTSTTYKVNEKLMMWSQLEKDNIAFYLTGKEEIINHGTMLIIKFKK